MPKKKKASEEKAGDYEVPVVLGDTDVVILVRMNDDIRQMTDDLTNQMKYQRGISSTQVINLTNEDVSRILRTSGIDVRNTKGGRRERIKIQATTEAVRGFHWNGWMATRFQAMNIAMLSDVFETDNKGKLRPTLRQDIAALISDDDISEIREAHFTVPDYDDEQYKYQPYPFVPDSSVPAEHLHVLVTAILRAFPSIGEQLESGRDRYAELEGGGEETDPNGFLPSAVD